MLVAKILRSTRNVRKSTMGLKLGADVRTQNEGCQNPRTGTDVLKNTYVSFPPAIYYAIAVAIVFVGGLCTHFAIVIAIPIHSIEKNHNWIRIRALFHQASVSML